MAAPASPAPARVLTVALVVALGSGAPTVSRAQIATGQQKCVNALNKGYEKVSKTHGKLLSVCAKAGARGRLVEPTVDDCVAADANGKVAKARDKTVVQESKKCFTPLPSFAYSDATTAGDAAVAASLGLALDLFDADLDAAILDAAGATAEASKCQLGVMKQTQKCVQTITKEFNKCKKAALAGKNGPHVTDRDTLRARCYDDGAGGVPDGKGKLAKLCTLKLADRVSKSCDGIDTAVAFPGTCAGTTDTAACIEARARCRACLGLNRVDWLQSECDLADNDLADASCVPLCGDGVTESPEQCDDGNTTSGDGCDSSCRAELPFALSLVNQNMLQNITVGNVGYDDLFDRLMLFADALAALQPDIVTLQEAVLGGSGTTSFLVADLTVRHGLTYHAVEYGFFSGNAVLSRWPVTLLEQRLLPDIDAVPSFPDRRFAARAQVASPIGALDVYAMHLCAGSIGCTMPDRTVQAQAFLDFVEATHSSGHPAIIGADFNAHTGTVGDANPSNDPPIDLLQAAGWVSALDGFDAPCDAPVNRSGCTSGIEDLTVPLDTTVRRIDNLMVAPASQTGPLPAVSVATEVGPTGRFADLPGLDPNAECHFAPRLACTSDASCPPATECHPNAFCVRAAPLPCTINADCPGDIAPENCRTTLWVSDHVGVRTILELQAPP